MFRDRVSETSTTTGTGNFTLAGAPAGYRTFSSAFSTNPAYYVIVNRANPNEWEVGSFTVSGTTLARVAGNVLAGSSGAGTLVNFSAGTKDVFNSPPASRLASWETGGSPTTVTWSGSISGDGRNPGGTTAVNWAWTGTGWRADQSSNCACDCACSTDC